MTTINDGGPAFPIPLNPGQSYQGHSPCDGMTLRDYFAAKALATASGYAADDLSTWSAEDFARHAYAIADAMLAARAAQSAISAAELLAHVQDLLKVFVHDPFDSQQLVDSVVARAEESVARAQLGVYA
ncbi:hypothetical protein [Bordetella bronchiseptica]|uniref:hypothetical protein n=1 Tax=Bordetella bronchiseptica TaxID=518 RepID=UPI00049EE999|nr:hypothetical protein [Bordetella bronchiseptica]KDB58408.1 hypothetical protein AZ15_1967 [Bordetella bronchiseptica A1-7]KDB69676.1 hypothetical protein AZ21_3798 [Bordetella bronchiseptica B20-10725633]KDB70746.1 hypothetical protein AZ21_1758 [Bordetella bronchiseptica B20-10725633]KDB73074.1 hypothetical protein AZ21_2222 [Bordetella bronchiseptica B20-10725633]